MTFIIITPDKTKRLDLIVRNQQLLMDDKEGDILNDEFEFAQEYVHFPNKRLIYFRY